MSERIPRVPLTGQQCRIILEVAECGDLGLVPSPSYLADFEVLRERGTLTRSMATGQAVYRLSDAYKAARAKHLAMEPQTGEEHRN